MILRIKLKNNLIRISLQEGKKEIDSVEIADPRQLSEKILPEIDALLKKNKLSIKDIEKTETDSDLPDSYTSTRIIEATAKGLNFKG